jgi:hypothetical protein
VAATVVALVRVEDPVVDVVVVVVVVVVDVVVVLRSAVLKSLVLFNLVTCSLSFKLLTQHCILSLLIDLMSCFSAEL